MSSEQKDSRHANSKVRRWNAIDNLDVNAVFCAESWDQWLHAAARVSSWTCPMCNDVRPALLRRWPFLVVQKHFRPLYWQAATGAKVCGAFVKFPSMNNSQQDVFFHSSRSFSFRLWHCRQLFETSISLTAASEKSTWTVWLGTYFITSVSLYSVQNRFRINNRRENRVYLNQKAHVIT